MRFVWAVAAFVLAAVMIGAGFAQRTVFQGPSTATDTVKGTSGAPFILIDGAVLNTRTGTQTLRAEGSGKLFASYGTTADMKAWLADTTYDHVTVDKAGKVTTTTVEPTVSVPADDSSGGDGGTVAAPSHSPVGSDLWLEDFQQDGVLVARINVPATTSVLVATDGTKAAPSHVSVQWRLQNATPWAGPLIVGGSILLAVGVFLYILAIRHVRRSRGPRRKALPPLPTTEPIDLSEIDADKGVITALPVGNRQEMAGRRAFGLIPVVAVSALLFTGCSADAWPQLASDSTPTPTASPTAVEGKKPPVVTEGQAARILAHVSEAVAAADAKKDPIMAATRLDGPMLSDRVTNYTLQKKVKGYKPLEAVPSQPLDVVLAEATDRWPRTVLTVVSDPADKKAAPVMMMLTQRDVWSDYKLTYATELQRGAVLPLSARYDAALEVQPDTPLLSVRPDQIPAAYADVLTNGDKSPNAAMFDLPSDQFRPSVMAARKKQLAIWNKKTGNGKTGKLTFTSTAGDEPVQTLVTTNNGAIVAVNVYEMEKAHGLKGATVGAPPTTKALAGIGKTAPIGTETRLSDQLFFYVPASGSDEKIRLLGYSSHLLDAKVTK